jgi:hypothetical protein
MAARLRRAVAHGAHRAAIVNARLDAPLTLPLLRSASQAYVGEPPEELKKMDYFHEARRMRRLTAHSALTLCA